MRPLTLAAAFFVATSASAASGSAGTFQASCKDVRSDGYRLSLAADGTKIADEWFHNDRFRSTWIIRYRGGTTAEIDGKPVQVVMEAGPVLILGEAAKSNTSASYWVYVVHRTLQKVAASQVNGYDALGQGVKVRSVQFECTFT